jgi:hypothetical protein
MREPRPSRGSNSPGPTTRVPSDDDGAVTGGNEDHHLDPFARLDVDMGEGLHSRSVHVTLVTRSRAYACAVSRAGRRPVLVSVTVARSVPVDVTTDSGSVGSESCTAVQLSPSLKTNS